MPGEHLDLTSEPPKPPAPAGGRPFLGVLFNCCQCYGRIYLRDDHTAYEGRCPRCGGALRVEVSPDGDPGRFFSAG